MIFVNNLELNNIIVNCSNYVIFILKKIWLKKESRYMTLKEMASSQFVTFIRKECENQDEKLSNISIIENSPEEIRDTIIEMEEQLNGNWQATPEDEKMQQEFWNICLSTIKDCFDFDYKHEYFGTKLRIGASFLKNNLWLLD